MADGIEYAPEDLAALAEPLVLLESGSRRVVAPNRIVYQPMEANDGSADGSPSEGTMLRYMERANGFAGIDVFEALAVSEDGKAREHQLVLGEHTLAGFKHLVKRYRGANDTTPILFQLTHSGRFAETPVTPYPLADVRLLTDADVERIQAEFVAAAVLARKAGADGIDFKHCHGYLGGAFLAPANVAREGWSWGGDSLSERSRFLRETLALMMAEAPPDAFVTMVRISAYEGIPGGFGSRDATSVEEDENRAELQEFCRILEKADVHVVNQSAGIPELTPDLVRQTNDAPEGFARHQEWAAAIKGATGLVVVGSGYSYAKAGRNRLPGDAADTNIVTLGGRAIREGRTDMIGIGRQCLAEPYFARKLLAGQMEAIRWDTSCSKCGLALRSGIPAGCVTYDARARARFKAARE